MQPRVRRFWSPSVEQQLLRRQQQLLWRFYGPHLCADHCISYAISHAFAECDSYAISYSLSYASSYAIAHSIAHSLSYSGSYAFPHCDTDSVA